MIRPAHPLRPHAPNAKAAPAIGWRVKNYV